MAHNILVVGELVSGAPPHHAGTARWRAGARRGRRPLPCWVSAPPPPRSRRRNRRSSRRRKAIIKSKAEQWLAALEVAVDQ
jgi:hypothetical protein